jgi:FkbH-like protein
MPNPTLQGLLISDFTVDNLRSILVGMEEEPPVDLEVASSTAVFPALMDSTRWTREPDFAVVWTRPEGAVPSFARILRYEDIPDSELLAEVDAYAAALLTATRRVRCMLVPTWTIGGPGRGLGLLDGTHRRGCARVLDLLNARLVARLQDGPNLYVLDSRRWFMEAPTGGYDPRLWYLAKVPYTAAVFNAAARDVKAALRAVSGRARKLIVVDLDDTLWGGILGEVGWQGLRLGGHDPAGEAYLDFQRALKALTRRGVILGIASKNDEANALEAIREHPEMALRLDDFAGWRIDWGDKARNIADLVQSLNLGLDAVVFIDDNPAERGRVRDALPGVLVPEWPPSPLLYPTALESLTCFDTAQWSAEDADRAQLYSADRQRVEFRESAGSVETWLETLGIRIRVEGLGSSNIHRAAQLLNKTNQMNLSTRRLTEPELLEWAGHDGNMFWTLRMSDRFSDSGITGLLGVAVEEDRLRVVDWVLSCRVMGRLMEETMLHVAAEHGRAIGARELVATHLPTERNGPCLNFWRERSGFTVAGHADTFRWPLAEPYPLPRQVSLELEIPAT